MIINLNNTYYILILCAVLIVPFSVLAEDDRADRDRPVPTHADAAMVFSKFMGLFDRYIEKDASLTECVAFLNENGIYFGLMEVVNGTEFTRKDCARVMGQMELVFSGEAEYLMGKVKLPNGIASWEEFCIMNDVKYVEGFAAVVNTLTALSALKD